jgi:PAS domain S-box-containing protein
MGKCFISFRKKTLLIHAVLFLISLLAMLPLVKGMISQILARSIKTQASQLIGKIQKAPNLDRMIEYLQAEKPFVFYRVTLFDREQRVIYDSHFSIASDEHQQLLKEERKEVIDAIKYGNGYGDRYSAVFRQSITYASLFFSAHGKEYVLRIGAPFTEILTLSHNFEIAFLTAGALFFLFYGLMIWLMIQHFSRPVQEIIAAIQPYQEGKAEFIPRIEIGKDILEKNEFARVAQAFNALNERIQKQISNLVEQRERTQEILESLGEGVIALDADGKITFANQAFCQMMGAPYDSLINRTFRDILARRQDIIKTCQELIGLALEKMETITRTYTVEESPRLYFDLIAAPQAKRGGVILVLQDKTSDYKVIEMGKDFIANASHELRTPITIIRGFAETLHDLPQLTKAQTVDVTEKIVKTCIRLDSLVKSLLTLSDIENLSEEQFHFADLVAIAENCRRLLLTAHPNVKLSFNKKINQAPIWADVDLLSMAVMNLLENAVKYSPSPAEITIAVDHFADVVQLNVKDQGIGIPEGDLPRIFDRFYTVDKARSRRFGGAGLGLSIVKTVIQKHSGDVSVVSRLGHGSEFVIRLPLYRLVPNA